MNGSREERNKKLVSLPLLCLAVFTCLSSLIRECESLSPSIKGMTNLRREFSEGEDMLLTCVVRNIGTHTVIWSKIVNGRKKIIAIDKLTVIQDDRIHILHDEALLWMKTRDRKIVSPQSDGAPNFNSTLITAGGDVWVLSIKNVTTSDSGGYICRVNSSPPAQSYYMVQVKPVNNSTIRPDLRSNHNYTDCCLQSGVDSRCNGFCNLHDILEGRTGIEPEKCEDQFPKIVQCMADFRDHSPCCVRQGIPDICQDLCRGEYTIQDDYVKSHFSCTAFTEVTLLCISEGVEILPEPPQSPSVEILGPHSILVEWIPPKETSPLFDHFVINITTLQRFDPPVDGDDEPPQTTQVEALDDNDDLHFVAVPKKMQIKVPANITSFKVDNLSPMTWYEISVTSLNSFGSSLTPYKIRSLTPAVGTNATVAATVPELPDIMSCCISKGVKHDRCLQNLCNPGMRYIQEPDMIVCAAWAQETFSCLTGDIDHSDCCRERGLPDVCVELCTGNVTKIDYSYFRCVDYFTDYRSCLLKGYGVLPGAPKNVRIGNVHPTFGLLSWDPPMENADSITSYHAYYRPINPTRECLRTSFNQDLATSYLGLHVKSSPQVLENLCPGTEYEVYIEAFNVHGTSDPSSRILFRSTTLQASTAVENVYNATHCCNAVNVSPGCLPLCQYNVRMSHFRTLSQTCTPEMPKVFRCIVGGRDHGDCCTKRGVPDGCLNLCTGSIGADERTPAGCLPYIGNIFMCLEEGVDVLPGPISSLHATAVYEGGVTLQWDAPVDGKNVTNYEVHYQEVDKFSATHAVFRLNNSLTVTEPFALLKDLKSDVLYNIFVTSINEWGSSLPSSVLTLNITEQESKKSAVAGVPSAPHSLTLEGKSATSLTIIWQPPLVAHPTDRLSYKLHYASLSLKNMTPFYNVTFTSSTAQRLEGLSPNTQYIIFVVALNDLGESRPSETLLAWTDPAYPAFVETPTVHPTNLVVEGGSMTVLCIAMGSPNPNVSLYISGVFVHQDVTRHMVTVVTNVTRDMTEISCYADNGYGTPMQSSVSITVSHRPTITAEEEVKVVFEDEVTLECQVSAWPEPSLVWWKDVDSRVPVIHGGNVSLSIVNLSKGKYIMRLKLKRAEDSQYFCHASNALGSFTHTVKIRTYEQIRQRLDISQCCVTNNVSNACLSACDFDQIDFHKQMNREECIPDFGKLLLCGADVSDHRGCCAKKGVPHHCLDWCRSKQLQKQSNYQQCLLQWAPLIFDCFVEGRDALPGPPRNVQFNSLTSTTAKISWEIPAKNAKAVELYRVFWREKGTRFALTNDTSNTSLYIRNLTEGMTYEVAVKAGNHLGTSLLTETEMFTHNVPYISLRSTSDSTKGVAVGISMGIVILIALGGLAWWVFKKRQVLMKSINGISFENPSYIREQNGDTVQIAETPNGSLNGTITNLPLSNGGLNGSINNSETSNGTIWNTQSVNSSGPGFETDIDSKGGYKRFKS